MKSSDIAHQRLHNQRLSSPEFKKPSEVVRWLGAVQAQDYYGAKWALGLRMVGATDEAIEKAFANGELLRTHVMRPTWHFVTPADIRWLLKLTAPRVNAAMTYNYRKFELDNVVFKHTNKALITALRGGKQLTRDVLRAFVNQAGVATDDLVRFAHILIKAELDGLICSGVRKGKQFTYALLDERVSQSSLLSREESLAELTRRYFTSHGPATLQDFVWWSGLTAKDAKSGTEMIHNELTKEEIEGKLYWLQPSKLSLKSVSRDVYLLPAYDEYLIAYRDRSAAIDPGQGKPAMKENAIFSSSIILAGRIVGNWKRTIESGIVNISLSPFEDLTKLEMLAVIDAAQRYGEFLGLRVAIQSHSM